MVTEEEKEAETHSRHDTTGHLCVFLLMKSSYSNIVSFLMHLTIDFYIVTSYDRAFCDYKLVKYPSVENCNLLFMLSKLSKYKQYKHKSGRVRKSKIEEICFPPPVPATHF